MKLVFSDQPFPIEVEKTIFLAGPSPRYHTGDQIQTNTWRHEAIDILAAMGYDGHVFIPLPQSGFYAGTAGKNMVDYLSQIEWERHGLERADVIFFYVDRKEDNQGLTTNIEFGEYFDSGRMVYARPKDAVKVRYMDETLIARDREFYLSMADGLKEVLDRVKTPVHRLDGETHVPALIFCSEQFQEWYTNLKHAGNRLDGFVVKSIITFKNDRFLFGFNAWVNIFITKENRHKSNEWVFSRTATSYVVAYYDGHEDGDRRYILTREFRSPASNLEGYVYEMAGGSAVDKKVSPIENAIKELEEETGIHISDERRFRHLGSRQTFATYLTMQLFAVAVELTEEEFNAAVERANTNAILGENEEERITLHIATDKDLIQNKYPVDWTTLGMIGALKHYTK